MNKNDYNSTSISSISSSSSTVRGNIKTEKGNNDYEDDDDDDDDDDVGVNVDVDVDDQAPVTCPDQMVMYCKTFNLIDKENAIGGSKTHG